MNDCSLSIAITALACTIAQYLNDDELALLSVVLTQLGDTLGTISTQRTLCQNKQDHSSPSSGGTVPLSYQE